MNSNITLDELTPIELIELYGLIMKELKDRKVIRTNNFVGEIGEYLAIEYYSKTPGLPKLQAAPPSTKNIDAISIAGDRYSIKCTTGSTTGVFYGIPNPVDISDEQVKQVFEYLIIVKLDKNLTLQKIVEIDWITFLRHRKWHSRMNACNIFLSRSLESSSRMIYDSQLLIFQ